MRPPATCLRTCSSSRIGITGVSTAGFSARAPLTTRFARLERRAGAAAGAFATATDSAAATCWPRLRLLLASATGSDAPAGCSAVPATGLGTASAGAVGPSPPATSISVDEAGFFLPRLRLFRDLGLEAGTGITESVCTMGTSRLEVSISKPGAAGSEDAGINVPTGASAVGVNNATRGTRPASFRPLPRLTDTDFVSTEDFWPIGRESRFSSVSSEATAAEISTVESASSGETSPAVRRSAFLRAVRLAPPRERRFFFFAGSSASRSRPWSLAVDAAFCSSDFSAAPKAVGTSATGVSVASTSTDSSKEAVVA